jgi:aminoglycoside 3-N-acetyltransferase
VDSARPQTRESLAADLRRLGIVTSDVLLVHASMRALGWVCGGPGVVVLALLDAVGATGTVVVPAQTPDNRDPSRWSHSPVPEQWWPQIRAHLPAFDPAWMPASKAMGVVAEQVRTWPGAVRSGHPQTSFAAVGAQAEELMAGHALQSPLGEDSPLARLEKADAKALLLGVGYDKCTAFHLAEYRLPDRVVETNACVVATPVGRAWVHYECTALSDRDFAPLGEAFERAAVVATGRVGEAGCRLFAVRDAVAFAWDWLPRYRAVRSGTGP